VESGPGRSAVLDLSSYELEELEVPVLDPEEPEELDELDEPVELDGLDEDVLSLLLDELSLLVLLSELPLLSDFVSELFTSVFSPLFSGLALGSLSLSE
jgi:hypothetical protein